MPPCAAAALHIPLPLMMSLLTAANHLLPFAPVGKVGPQHLLNGPVLPLPGVTGRARGMWRDCSGCQPIESGELVTVAAWELL